MPLECDFCQKSFKYRDKYIMIESGNVALFWHDGTCYDDAQKPTGDMIRSISKGVYCDPD